MRNMQMAGPMLWQQVYIGTGRDGDGVFAVVAHANEGSASGVLAAQGV